VTRSKEAGKRLEEAKYMVDIGDEDVFSKVSSRIITRRAELMGVEKKEYGAEITFTCCAI
jgi:hypothetical protein